MFLKESYIKKLGPNKFRVFSEKGKNMGTYRSMSGARKRLGEIEFFRSQNVDDQIAPELSNDVVDAIRQNFDYGDRLLKIRAMRVSIASMGLMKEAKMIYDIENFVLKASKQH